MEGLVIKCQSMQKDFGKSLSRLQAIHVSPTDREISVYRDSTTKIGIARAIAQAAKAFPGLSKAQLQILSDRMMANGFTDRRAMDAVNHVIDTYEGWGKQPNVANFIKFDRKVRIYTHKDVCQGDLWDYVEAIRVDGCDKPRWSMQEDVRRYGLTIWDNSKDSDH